MDSIWGDLEIDVHGRIDGGDRTEAASRIARFWRPRALPRRQAGPRWTDARPRLLARAAADGSRGHQRTPGLTPTPPGANRYIRRASFSAARRLHSSVRCARIPGPLTHLRPQPSGSFSPSLLRYLPLVCRLAAPSARSCEALSQILPRAITPACQTSLTAAVARRILRASTRDPESRRRSVRLPGGARERASSLSCQWGTLGVPGSPPLPIF